MSYWQTKAGFSQSPSNTFRIKKDSISSVKMSGSRFKTDDLRQERKQTLQDKGRIMVNLKSELYQRSSLLSQFHEKITFEIKNMPSEVVKYLNINHFQSELQHSVQLIDEWELDLIAMMTQVEENIVLKLFKTPNTAADEIGKSIDTDIDPQKNFNTTFLSKLVLVMNETIHKAIKLLYTLRPQTAQAIENLWKLIVFILDITISWGNNRKNQHVLNEIKETRIHLEQSRSECRQLEHKLMAEIKGREQDMQREQHRYFELQEQCESLRQRIVELSNSRDEDVRYIANGGLSNMNSKISELEVTLRTFAKEVSSSSLDLRSGIKGVANTLMMRRRSTIFSLKLDQISASIRGLLNINISEQIPGDIAFGNLVSEHPWLSVLYLRNLMQDNVGIDISNKQQMLNEFMCKPIQDGVPPTILALQMRESFSQKVRYILDILRQPEEQTAMNIQIYSIMQRIFNFGEKEGLEPHIFVQFQRFYQAMNKIISGESFQKRLSYEQSKKYLNILKNNLGEQQQQNYQVLEEYVDEKLQGKETIYSHFLLMVIDGLHKMSTVVHKKRLQLFQVKMALMNEPINLLSLATAETLQSDLFPEYIDLDPLLIWRYLVMRYYVVYEKQILFNGAILDKEQIQLSGKKRGSMVGHEQEAVFVNFMNSNIGRIKTMLIFNPKVFCGFSVIEDDVSDSSSRQQSFTKVASQQYIKNFK